MDINICFSSDNNYVQHLGVAIASILVKSSIHDNYNFYIMDGGIDDKNKQKLEALKSIRNFNISYTPTSDEDFKNCPMTNYVNYITLPTYYRFKIPTYFKNVEKMLYMDCDMIVMDDIAPLFETNIDNYYVAAVPEVYNHHHKERLDFNPEEYYFNAGLLLINNKKWQEDNIEQKLFEYALNPKHEIIYQDQDILNEVLKSKVLYLDLKWNLQHDALFSAESYIYHVEERLEALKNPYIIHFTHKLKPWIVGCNNPFRKEYVKYLKMTQWKNYVFKLLLANLINNIKIFIIKFCKRLFSIEKKDAHKIINILGLKLKFRRQELYNMHEFNSLCENINSTKNAIDDLYAKIDNTKDAIEKDMSVKIEEIRKQQEIILNHLKWHDHPLYCINNGVNAIFRYMTGLQLTKDYQTERIIAFDFEDAPVDHYERYKFAQSYINENDKVLDVACGVGYGTSAIAQKARSVVGVDINQASINFANKIFANEKLSFECKSALDLNYENEFDKIISFETIEHLTEDDLFIKNLYKALKPGATLICSVPNQSVFPYDPKVVPFHIKHYTVESIKNLLTDNGFRIKDLYFQYSDENHKIMKKDNEGYTIVCFAEKSEV